VKRQTLLACGLPGRDRDPTEFTQPHVEYADLPSDPLIRAQDPAEAACDRRVRRPSSLAAAVPDR